MDLHDIEQLITRYWNGETTPDEERQIRDFYARHDQLPVHLEAERNWFAETDRIGSASLSSDFDQQILDRIARQNNQPAEKTKKIRLWISTASVAATLILIISLGVKTHRDQALEREARQALKVAKEILYFTSAKMNEAETLTSEQLTKIKVINEYINIPQ